MQKFIQLTGIMNFAAGVLLLAFWYLYALLLPYQELDHTLSILVVDRHWVLVNLLGVAGSLCGLLGLVGMVMKTVDTLPKLGFIGFILAFFATVLFTATLVWDTLLWPILVKHNPALLDFNGPLYTSSTFVPFFIMTGVAYSAGCILFGLALAKSGGLPYWGCLLITTGTPIFGLGAMFGKLQIYPRTLGITLLCVGLLIIGSVMISPKQGKWTRTMPISAQER